MRWRRDYKKIKYPIGWLSPEGKWYLLDDSNGRAYHFKAANKLVEENNLKAYGFYAEEVLEHEGYIKIRKSEIRYLANFPYSGYYNQENPHTPDITEEQQKELYKYMQWAFEEYGYIDINGRTIMSDFNGRFQQDFTLYQFKQMDKFALRKIFDL